MEQMPPGNFLPPCYPSAALKHKDQHKKSCNDTQTQQNLTLNKQNTKLFGGEVVSCDKQTVYQREVNNKTEELNFGQCDIKCITNSVRIAVSAKNENGILQ